MSFRMKKPRRCSAAAACSGADPYEPSASHHFGHRVFGRGHLGIGQISLDPLKIRVLPALGSDDPRAVRPKFAGNGQTDAHAPAGHKRDLSVETFHLTGFPPLTSTTAPHM